MQEDSVRARRGRGATYRQAVWAASGVGGKRGGRQVGWAAVAATPGMTAIKDFPSREAVI